jgi:hypothetical protein
LARPARKPVGLTAGAALEATTDSALAFDTEVRENSLFHEADLDSAGRKPLYHLQQSVKLQRLPEASLGTELGSTFFHPPIRREKYHGDAPCCRVRFKALEKPVAVPVRHVHVNKNQVRRGIEG